MLDLPLMHQSGSVADVDNRCIEKLQLSVQTRVFCANEIFLMVCLQQPIHFKPSLTKQNTGEIDETPLPQFGMEGVLPRLPLTSARRGRPHKDWPAVEFQLQNDIRSVGTFFWSTPLILWWWVCQSYHWWCAGAVSRAARHSCCSGKYILSEKQLHTSECSWFQRSASQHSPTNQECDPLKQPSLFSEFAPRNITRQSYRCYATPSSAPFA